MLSGANQINAHQIKAYQIKDVSVYLKQKKIGLNIVLLLLSKLPTIRAFTIRASILSALTISFLRLSFLPLLLVPFLLGSCGLSLTSSSAPSQIQSVTKADGSPDTSAMKDLSRGVDYSVSGLRRSTGHMAEIVGLFPLSGSSKTGGKMLSIDKNGGALLWDLKKHQAFEFVKLDNDISILAFSPDGALIAYPNFNTLKIYSLQSGVVTHTLQRLKTRIASLQFDPAGQSVLIGGADGRVYRWNFRIEGEAKSLRQEERILERYIGHAAVVSAVAFHPFGRVFFSGDWNGVFNAWLRYDADAQGGNYDENFFGSRFFSEKGLRNRAVRDDHQSLNLIRTTADGNLLLLGFQDGSVEIWQVRGFKKVSSVMGHKGLIYDIAINNESTLAVTSGRDGKVRTWTIKSDPNHGAKAPEVTLEPLKEIEAAGAKRLVFIEPKRVSVGLMSGKILDIAIE